MSRVSEGPLGRTAVQWPPTWIVALLAAFTTASHADDVIILRSKLPVKDRKVEVLDPDGVHISGGTILAWEDIDSGRLDHDQDRFDAMLKDLGGPLYQIGRSLKQGEHAAALESAERLFPLYVSRRSRTAHTVAQALMWGLLNKGQRERSVLPFLVVMECQRAARERVPPPGTRRLNLDLSTGLSHDLLPLFLNATAAREVLPEVRRFISGMASPVPPGVRLLVAGLAIAALELDGAATELAQLGEVSKEVIEWHQALAARLDGARGRPAAATIAQYQRLLASETELVRLFAHYSLGETRVAQADEETRRSGVIDLLYLPAVYPNHQPDLTAAALDLAARTLEDLGDPEAKLLRKGPQTRASAGQGPG